MTKHYYYRVFLTLIASLFFYSTSYSNSKASQPKKTMVVIIDPGHGGKDPGAVSHGIREKDVVLGIGLKLGKLIHENFPDVKVIFTRSTDVFVPLIERSRIANKNKANLFISLHANFCGTPSIRGTETYVLGLHRSEENLEVAKKENSVILLEDNYKKTYEGFDPNLSESYIMFELVQDVYMDQSLAFANDIQQQFDSKLTSANRGVKQAGFLVLRESSMPSVLVETGFISNPTEARYLMSEKGQSKIANSILEAFRKFKERTITPATPVLADKNKPDIKSDPEPEKITTGPAKENPEHVKSPTLENKPVLNAEKTKFETKKIKEQTPKIQSAPETAKTTVPEKKSVIPDNTYYCVQIAASKKKLAPTSYNFKGLQNVRCEKGDTFYRYFVGKENSMDDIIPLWKQVKLKIPNAFVVSFKDGKRTIIDTTGK